MRFFHDATLSYFPIFCLFSIDETFTRGSLWLMVYVVHRFRLYHFNCNSIILVCILAPFSLFLITGLLRLPSEWFRNGVVAAGLKLLLHAANHLSIDGSLCGLQLLDLTPEGNRNQKVLHVGCDPPQTESLPSDLLTGKAFNFTLSRPGASAANSAEYPGASDAASGGKMRLVVRVASVYYLHAPNLLLEVSQCITEFKDYLATIRASLATAAKELALGLVHKHSDPLNPAAHGSSCSLDGKLNRFVFHIGGGGGHGGVVGGFLPCSQRVGSLNLTLTAV